MSNKTLVLNREVIELVKWIIKLAYRTLSTETKNERNILKLERFAQMCGFYDLNDALR